jgi:hypothetical protein
VIGNEKLAVDPHDRRVKMAKEIEELDAQEEISTNVPDDEDELDEEMADVPEEPKIPISELRRVRAEAAKYRKQLRQLESKVAREQKASELAKMEETDRLKAIAEEAEAKAKILKEKANTIAKRAAIISAASALNFYSPQDAASMVDLGQIEVADDGTVDEQEINELVKSLVESKPYLVRGQSDSQDMAGFGPTNPASSNWPRPKFRTKDQIDRMKQQSNEAMRSGRVSEAVRLYNQAWEMERGVKKGKRE